MLRHYRECWRLLFRGLQIVGTLYSHAAVPRVNTMNNDSIRLKEGRPQTGGAQWDGKGTKLRFVLRTCDQGGTLPF